MLFRLLLLLLFFLFSALASFFFNFSSISICAGGVPPSPTHARPSGAPSLTIPRKAFWSLSPHQPTQGLLEPLPSPTHARPSGAPPLTNPRKAFWSPSPHQLTQGLLEPLPSPTHAMPSGAPPLTNPRKASTPSTPSTPTPSLTHHAAMAFFPSPPLFLETDVGEHCSPPPPSSLLWGGLSRLPVFVCLPFSLFTFSSSSSFYLCFWGLCGGVCVVAVAQVRPRGSHPLW